MSTDNSYKFFLAYLFIYSYVHTLFLPSLPLPSISPPPPSLPGNLKNFIRKNKNVFFLFHKNREQEGKIDPVWGIGPRGRREDVGWR
jgi:hypothetical protein